MRSWLKFGHELGSIGAMGAAAGQLILSSLGPELTAEEHAIVRRGIVALCRGLLLPSVLVALLSGVFAMAVTRAFHSADWAWVKVLMTPLVFEATLVAVDSPARAAADLSARVASGDDTAAAALAAALHHERGGLIAVLVLFGANVALAVWRPRRKNRLESADPPATREPEAEVLS